MSLPQRGQRESCMVSRHAAPSHLAALAAHCRCCSEYLLSGRGEKRACMANMISAMRRVHMNKNPSGQLQVRHLPHQPHLRRV